MSVTVLEVHCSIRSLRLLFNFSGCLVTLRLMGSDLGRVTYLTYLTTGRPAIVTVTVPVTSSSA